PIRVRPHMKRAESSELTGADDLAHGADMWAEALRVTAEKLDFVFDRCLDHLLSFLERDRHRFFDDDVFAGVGGDDRMGHVKLVGRRDPYGLDVRVGAHFLDAIVSLGAVALAECFQHPRINIRGRNEFEFRYLLHCREDFRGADANADNAKLQLSLHGLACIFILCHHEFPFIFDPQPKKTTDRRGAEDAEKAVERNLSELCGREKKSKFGNMSRSRMSAVSQL